MTSIWVVAADSGHARFFHSSGRTAPLIELETLVEPAMRLPEQAINSDGHGSGHGGNGAHHGVDGEPAARREIASRFARSVCDHLRSGRAAGEYERLYIVAAPATLGRLRDNLDAPTRAAVCGEVDKNLVSQAPKEIRAHLPDFL